MPSLGEDRAVLSGVDPLKRWSPLLLAALPALTGVVLLARAADDGLQRRHVVVDGVPLDAVRPATPAGPGVVVAHGFAGSARLMAQFGDTLAARGYTVVLPDLDGHGASTRSPADLQHDLAVAVAHLRTLPGVDPDRLALVGHSMGAGAVTEYAAAHPAITATVAISLPGGDAVPRERPSRLLVLVGGLEFAGFQKAATAAVDNARADRAAVVVPGVEHISILYAPRTHRLTADWLDHSFGRPPDPGPLPSPLRRLVASGVLLVGLLLGFHPATRLLLGPVPSPRRTARQSERTEAAVDVTPGRGAEAKSPGGGAGFGAEAKGPGGDARQGEAVAGVGKVAAVAGGAAVLAVLVAPVLPTVRLPLALGGHVAGFATVMGVAILAYLRSFASAPGDRRALLVAPLIIAYAAAAIAVPLHLGFTHAVPVGPRWWLLLMVQAGFATLAYATSRLSGGTLTGDLLVAALVVIALTVAALTGLAAGFLLLVVPLLAVLMVIQAGLAAVLRARAAPLWLTALTGSVLVAWPIATTLPIAVQ